MDVGAYPWLRGAVTLCGAPALDVAWAKCQARARRYTSAARPGPAPGRISTAGPGGGLAAAGKETVMSVYRVTEIIGTSGTSWEDAAAEAIRTAAGTLRDLRVAEVVKQDIALDESGTLTYRTKLQLSFKYEQER